MIVYQIEIPYEKWQELRGNNHEVYALREAYNLLEYCEDNLDTGSFLSISDDIIVVKDIRHLPDYIIEIANTTIKEIV